MDSSIIGMYRLSLQRWFVQTQNDCPTEKITRYTFALLEIQKWMKTPIDQYTEGFCPTFIVDISLRNFTFIIHFFDSLGLSLNHVDLDLCSEIAERLVRLQNDINNTYVNI